MKKFKSYLKKLYKIIISPSMSYLPGNLAFSLVLSIFPILTLIGVIASNFSINIAALTNFINKSLPPDVADVLATFISGKGFDSNIGIFMIIGFYLASNGADSIILASNNLYQFKNSDYVKRRIKSLFLIGLIIFSLIFLLGFLGFGIHIIDLLLSKTKDVKFVSLVHQLFNLLKWPFSIFIILFNLKLIYTIAPDNKIKSKTTTTGAIFTTFSWVVVVEAYSYWVTNFSNYDIFYGSLSNIVILMLIIYLISFLLIIGIAINVRQYEYDKKNGE